MGVYSLYHRNEGMLLVHAESIWFSTTLCFYQLWTHPNQPHGPPSLQYCGHHVFFSPQLKVASAWG